jgi:hypothetical protein
MLSPNKRSFYSPQYIIKTCLDEISEEDELKMPTFVKSKIKPKEKSYDSPSTTGDSQKHTEYFKSISKSSKKESVSKTIFEYTNTETILPVIQNRKISDNTEEFKRRVNNLFSNIDDIKKIINKRNTKIKINSVEGSLLNFQNKYPIKVFKK